MLAADGEGSMFSTSFSFVSAASLTFSFILLCFVFPFPLLALQFLIPFLWEKTQNDLQGLMCH